MQWHHHACEIYSSWNSLDQSWPSRSDAWSTLVGENVGKNYALIKSNIFTWWGGGSYLWSSNCSRLHSVIMSHLSVWNHLGLHSWLAPCAWKLSEYYFMWSIIGVLIDYIHEEYQENIHKYAKISYMNNDLLHGLAKHVAIFREVKYKGWINLLCIQYY